MNVYTHLFFDQINWPLSLGADTYILNHGVKLAIPRFATQLELFRDVFTYSVYYTFDFKLHFYNFLTFIELWSIRVYSNIISISHKGLIAELENATTATFEHTLYNPSHLLVSFFNFYFYSIIFICSLLYLYVYGLRNTSSAKGLTEGGIHLYAYLDEVEEECGQLEDFISYVIYFAVFVLWFYFFHIFVSAIILKNLNWLLTLFCFILILGLVIPSKLLVQVGLAFAQYVRGSGKGTILLFETLLDFVSVSVIIIRFFVQNVRFVFIFVGFFEYYEYIDLKIYPISDVLLPYISWDDYWLGKYDNWYWFEVVLQVFTQLVSYVYYVGHLTITYIAQLAIYIILSFWIYFFLYTTFAMPSGEKYFYFKRYALLIK